MVSTETTLIFEDVTHVGEAPKLSALVVRDDLIQQHALGAVQLLVTHAHPDVLILDLRDASSTKSSTSNGFSVVRSCTHDWRFNILG